MTLNRLFFSLSLRLTELAKTNITCIIVVANVGMDSYINSAGQQYYTKVVSTYSIMLLSKLNVGIAIKEMVCRLWFKICFVNRSHSNALTKQRLCMCVNVAAG